MRRDLGVTSRFIHKSSKTGIQWVPVFRVRPYNAGRVWQTRMGRFLRRSIAAQLPNRSAGTTEDSDLTAVHVALADKARL